MAYEERGEPTRGSSRRTRGPSVRITPARFRGTPGLEIRKEGEWLEVTFAAPDIAESTFRYRVGKRYLLVWSDEGAPGLHHFVNLPVSVDRGEHLLSFRNGVVDARLRMRAS